MSEPARAPKNRASPRVVLATRLFAPEVSAGSFRLRALARALIKRSATVRVLTTTPPSTAPPGCGRPAGSPHPRFPVLRDAGGNVRGYLQYLSFDAPLVFRLLVSRFDLAIAEAPPTTGIIVAAISAFLATTPLRVLRGRHLDRRRRRDWCAAIHGRDHPWSRRPDERNASTVLSISDEVTERIVRFGVGAERIATVGNGIDTDVFNPDGPVADGITPYFVYTGTMSEWQGAEVFIRALPIVRERFPDIRLRFFWPRRHRSAVAGACFEHRT